jgi:serine phosphatase RsbU (regulator of sigma subunit)
VAGIEFVAEYRPAYSIGGDFYDVFWLDERRLAVFIGDVSGKGVSAALLMARISSDLRIAALAEREPAAALRRVNRTVLERRQHDIFVTGIYLTLDVHTREVVIANAGHVPPYVRRSEIGSLQRLDQASSTPIGAFEEAEYEALSITLQPGDTLILTTDGVLEATSPRGEQFGFQRMEQAMGEASSRALEVTTRLLRDVRRHVGDAAPYDDLTLITFGVIDPKGRWRDESGPHAMGSYTALTERNRE